MALTIQPIEAPYPALGIATHFLARRAPFSGFRFGDFVNTLDGQIRRRHALFAIDDGRMVGYLGWAVYSAEDARQFACTGRPPPNDRANGTEVVWVLTAAAVSPAGFKALIDTGKSLNIGRRAMGVRYKPSGAKIVFDQLIRARHNGPAGRYSD
ncbi:hypothetical protein ASG40_19145 [Methylobacterium sp. Leaf399]|uniref:hypothetical protein n=1 Tax=unclassified Methylobacterium TaxID=2615210 RepID=UPI0006FF5BBB|nr:MULTISPECIES: hypothetical protein [unclassified Methylobacterium]KQP54191.1 hypothetical protein ASF39_19645 [Methylobacterium sp. Leaf108]KQT14484.1 hypothetical protein ASG40_19145 [Methylobacterium sp. Leaf399]